MATPYRLRDLNGTEWLGPGSPVQIKVTDRRTMLTGLTGAPNELDNAHGVDQRGVTVKGVDFKAGAITMTVAVHPGRYRGLTGDAAVDVLAEFIDGLGEGEAERGDNQMQFEVVSTERFQVVRKVKLSDPDWEKMRWAGFNALDLAFQSDESDWRTEPLDITFAPAGFASAKVRNDGTVPSWPWFKLTGPITNPTLGIGGEAIALPNLTTGQWLEIDTDPNWYQVTDRAGADRAWEVTSIAKEIEADDDRWRNQAPARTSSIPVTITGSGTSGATSLRVVVPQIYRSAL